ncbi:hypothetical protein RvY_01380 [Ramazzottius varieornatus]|uniref:Nucleoside phosphorylase domain-containing protein n=1 Tax=Ramazzottius varieornatus TaxID=947166 RepID=A0A1D1UM73_RAMVA|nr:hypothetical protein RvY_01380 [Ramazzottius varieornatus]
MGDAGKLGLERMNDTLPAILQTLNSLQASITGQNGRSAVDQTEALKQLSSLRQLLETKAKSSKDHENPAREDFNLRNKHLQKKIEKKEPDFLYHLGLVVSLNSQTVQVFRDIKYVCVGGTPSRMFEFAVVCLGALKIQVPAGMGVTDLCGGHARYVMYKAGPVLTVSHGMGNPSLSIMMHEILKLLHYARAERGVKFIRIGTCGGVGVPLGTTVITEKVYNGLFQPYFTQYILGKQVQRPAILDAGVSRDLMHYAAKSEMNIPVVSGNTLCANDFYEEQARIDGAFCEFNTDEQKDFLQKCYHAYGIRNFEMESLAFSAMCHLAGVKAAVVCVTLMNRLESDQVDPEVEAHLEEWQRRPQRIVAELIKQEMANDGATVSLSDGLRPNPGRTCSRTGSMIPSVHSTLDPILDHDRARSPEYYRRFSISDSKQTTSVPAEATSVASGAGAGTFRPVDPAAVANCSSADVVLK